MYQIKKYRYRYGQEVKTIIVTVKKYLRWLMKRFCIGTLLKMKYYKHIPTFYHQLKVLPIQLVTSYYMYDLDFREFNFSSWKLSIQCCLTLYVKHK